MFVFVIYLFLLNVRVLLDVYLPLGFKDWLIGLISLVDIILLLSLYTVPVSDNVTGFTICNDSLYDKKEWLWLFYAFIIYRVVSKCFTLLCCTKSFVYSGLNNHLIQFLKPYKYLTKHNCV